MTCCVVDKFFLYLVLDKVILPFFAKYFDMQIFKSAITLTSCLFTCRYSAKGTVVRKIPLIIKGLIHLIDYIFWNLGFKYKTQA